MAKVKLPPIQEIELDPYQAYEVRAANGKYRGQVFGFDFLNGKGRIDALAVDAEADEVAERREQLEWFINGETHKIASGHTFDEETGKVETAYTFKRPYELVAMGKSNAPRPRAESRKPKAEEPEPKAETAGALA